jgi:hypothetical protein
MNFLKRGPELKMPELKLSSLKASKIKVPPALSDIYWDLRDRHLLPLVALVIVAIVAVPFLLSGGSDESPAPNASETGAASISTTGREVANLTVVKATPGLRDYRKRLAHHTEKDPFKQKYTAPVLAGTQLGGGGGASASSTTVTTTTTEGGSPEGGGASPEPSTPAETHPAPPSSSPPGDSSPSGELTFYAWAIKARIVKSGGNNAIPKNKDEPVVKKQVLPQTALPGDKAPVATYMGPSKHSKKGETPKVLLLVSSKVKSVFGEMKCVSGDDACQLIEVEPGFPVTFVYGENEVHYTINVLKVEPVVIGHS